MHYTLKEKTERNYTVAQAVKTALMLLKEKGYTQVCTNKVFRRQDNEALALPEFNELVSDLVDDTLFHEGAWFGAPTQRH